MPGDGTSARARTPARLYASSGPAGIRLLARLDPMDEAAYREAVGRLATRIELALGPQVVANRVVLRELAAGGRGLQLEAWWAARRRFRREARGAARSAGALLLADVRRCYASIDRALVAEALSVMGCRGRDVASVVRLLRRFEADGVPGLPVGPEPSAVLANAVLAAADRAVAAAGVRHLRWVDDFLIFARNRTHAEEALADLTACLEAMGLALAREKTRMVEDPSAFASAASWVGLSCLVGPYNRPSDAHDLQGLGGPHDVVSPGGGVAADRRPARAAGGNR